VNGAAFAHLAASGVLAPVFGGELEPAVGALPAAKMAATSRWRELVPLVIFLCRGTVS